MYKRRLIMGAAGVAAGGLYLIVAGRALFGAAEPVKPVETSSHSFWMRASRDGSLIQATVGSLGGVGRRWRKRAGLAA